MECSHTEDLVKMKIGKAAKITQDLNPEALLRNI